MLGLLPRVTMCQNGTIALKILHNAGKHNTESHGRKDVICLILHLGP